MKPALWVTTILCIISFAACGIKESELSNKSVLPATALKDSTTLDESELHVIGVREGKTPEGVDDRPWWAKCDDEPGLSKDECHAKYAGLRHETFVDLRVSYTKKPIVLALLGAERVTWNVEVTPEAHLRKIILAGNYPQVVKGLGSDVPIEIYTSRPSPSCDSCSHLGKGFFTYRVNSGDYSRAMKKLRELTNKKPTSVQLQSKGESLQLNNFVKPYVELPDSYRAWEGE